MKDWHKLKPDRFRQAYHLPGCDNRRHFVDHRHRHGHGAVLTVAGEQIVLHTADGSTIAADALTTADVLNASHVDVTPGSPLTEIVGTPGDDSNRPV